MTLSGKQRRFLRAQAHALEPVVSLGKEGITPSLVSAVSEALLTHELIKVRVLESAPLERKEVAELLPGEAKAELVGLIGRIVILYKRHPNKPKLTLPREPKAARGAPVDAADDGPDESEGELPDQDADDD
ncbi:MAG TPA: ribosome assembly RNA-binding protein YhbY [Polyangiales bacterium]